MNSILLAAGLSKRMGVQKLLLPFGETTVIETVIENMHGGGLSPIIAVFSREVADAVQERPEWLRIGINNAPERGQSSSLAIALDMLPDNEDFCIMLGDLPFVGSEEIKRLCECFFYTPRQNCFYPLQERSFRPPYVLSLSLERKVQNCTGRRGRKKHSDGLQRRDNHIRGP